MNLDTLDQDEFRAKQQPPRSWIGRLAVVLLFWLAIVYYLSPLLSAIRLAKAVENHETSRVADSVDFPALRKSIARQIVAEIARTLPADQSRAATNYGMLPAMAWLNDLLTDESVTDLLSGKTPSAIGAIPQNLSSLPPLSAHTIGKLVDVWWASGFVTLGEYRLMLPPVVGTDGMGLHFAISDYSWKLSGIELPDAMLAVAAKRWREMESRS